MVSVQLPASPREAEQHRALIVSRRQAGALLVAVTLVFVMVTLVGADGWLAYVQATAEASMVGGLADWFAVTALFRHPLGIPIPHTAIIVNRKDRFGATLGSFVAESFLTPDSIVERVHNARATERAAAWLATPANADRVARHVVEASVELADLLRDDEIQAAIEDAVRQRVERMDLAPAAGRLLATITRDGRHDELVDAGLAGLSRYLEEHENDLHLRFEQASPWWLPGAVEDRIFGRLLQGARNVLDDMVNDRGHQMRRHLEERIDRLVHDLQHDPALIERGEALKRDLLELPALREFVGSAWEDLKTELRAQAADPDSALRARTGEALATTARRFTEDPALSAKVEDAVESSIRYVSEHFDDEIAGLVTQTIERWDGEETSRRLELLLGPDLQYIRINGTVVGGMAGLALHGLAQMAG